MERETSGVMRILLTLFRRLKRIANMMYFWCKEDGIEEVEQLVDFLGYVIMK